MTPADEFPTLLDAALAEAKALTQQLTDRYRLFEFADWRFDETTGELRFGPYTRFAAQLVGLFDPAAETFTWGWADETLPEHVTRIARQACGWGEANDIPALTAATGPASVEDCWKLTAFTARLSNTPGVYAGRTAGPTVFLAYAPLPEAAR